ncbi:MAG: GFA family protein [Pseudomonadota bacterium]
MGYPKLPLNGSCLCGAVQVRITAPPLLTFACHCRDCQKLTASAYSLTVMFPSEGFEVSGSLTRGGLKTETRQHYFCSHCLNFIYSQIKGAEYRVNVRASLLDDLTWFEPFVELMTDEKLPWAQVPAPHGYGQFPATMDEFKALLADYAKRNAD